MRQIVGGDLVVGPFMESIMACTSGQVAQPQSCPLHPPHKPANTVRIRSDFFEHVHSQVDLAFPKPPFACLFGGRMDVQVRVPVCWCEFWTILHPRNGLLLRAH